MTMRRAALRRRPEARAAMNAANPNECATTTAPGISAGNAPRCALIGRSGLYATHASAPNARYKQLLAVRCTLSYPGSSSKRLEVVGAVRSVKIDIWVVIRADGEVNNAMALGRTRRAKEVAVFGARYCFRLFVAFRLWSAFSCTPRPQRVMRSRLLYLPLLLSLRETHDDISAPPPIEICRVYLVVYSLVSIRTSPNRSVSQVYDQVNRLE